MRATLSSAAVSAAGDAMPQRQKMRWCWVGGQLAQQGMAVTPNGGGATRLPEIGTMSPANYRWVVAAAASPLQKSAPLLPTPGRSSCPPLAPLFALSGALAPHPGACGYVGGEPPLTFQN